MESSRAPSAAPHHAERDGYHGASARQHPGSSKRTRGASRVERAAAPIDSATHLRSSASSAVPSPVALSAPAALRHGAACRSRHQPLHSSTHQRPLRTCDLCFLTSIPTLDPQSSFSLKLALNHKTGPAGPKTAKPHASARGFKVPACDLRLRLQPSLPPALNRRKRPSQITR